MELNSGDDLISLKESIQGHCSSSPKNSPSTVDADHYARCNGLTVDSLLLDWAPLVDEDQAIASTLVDIDPGQLIEIAQLPECLFRVIIPTAEQWQMPASSLQILQQVCGRSREDEAMDLVSQQCFTETSRCKHLKLEAPALRSDHGTDCRRLARRVRAFRKEPLPGHRLPLHPVDLEKGEGLEFSQSLLRMDREQMKTIGEESLEVARDTLVYLVQSLKADMADDDRWGFVDSVSTYQGVGTRNHLTPPLSPMTMALPEYFVPEAEFCELPEPSDPSSRLSDDIEAAESRLFDTEYEFWADTLDKNVSPERYDDVDVSEMIRAGECRPPIPPTSPQPLPRGLKVDVPLLPCSDDNVNVTETSRVLAPDDLAQAKELVASSDTLSGSDGPTGQLVSFFVERATTVMRNAEQEKLQPLDATARVAIPILDFSIPVPEWEQRLWEAKAMFRWIQKDIDVDWRGPKWTHSRAAEQRMVWTPLAHMRERELISEHLHVDSELVNSFLMRCHDGEVLTSADYVYKPPGLAIFRPEDEEDDDDDILEPLNALRQAPPHQPQDDSWTRQMSPWTEGVLQCSSSSTADWATPPPTELTTLLKRRKRLIDETLQRKETGEKRDWTSSSSDIIDPALIPSTNVLRGFMSEYTDFAPLVDNFVDINFPKKPKLTHSSFFAPPSPSPSSSRTTKAEEAAKLMPPPPKPIPALAPTITPPAVLPRIIVSSTTSTPITQHLQALLPNIELIHRDPSKHHPPTWSPGQPSPNLDEADIVVSPATGILLTTMLKLRQKALPPRVAHPVTATTTPTTGPYSNNNNNSNATTTTFSHIVANVSARHERLVVLVSEGNRHSETATPLSLSDARALAEFQGFAAGLSSGGGEVRVVYVSGGTETLAKWVAAVVCEYHAAEAGEEAVRGLVLPVETLWEVFLRRAGMNAFAAQVVLGRLRVPDGVPAVGGGDGGVFGLPLFVVMGRERRAEFFGEVFGGRRVLDRVSEVLDEPWALQGVEEAGLGDEMGPGWGRFHGENAQWLERW